MDTLLRRETEINDQADKSQKKRRWRIIIGLLIFLVVILIVIAIFIMIMWQRADSAFKQMYEPLGDAVVNLREEEGTPPLDLGEDPFSILILGLDEGRSDSMMLATINPNTQSSYLLSVPRDTMVMISGHGRTTRINHAYAYGGIDMAVNTIQDFLNVPVDYYITLDMYQFPALVDAFGGVRVYNNTVAFSMEGYNFPLGYIDLTGSAAFYYVRMRLDDPQGDFGRQERQRNVLGAMVRELAGVTLITRYQQIFDAAADQMSMNMTLDEAMTISMNYSRALRNVTHYQLHAPSQLIGGMYLVQVPEIQRLEMSMRLRNHLELE